MSHMCLQNLSASRFETHFAPHAVARMRQRRVSWKAVLLALDWGALTFSHGREVFVISRKAADGAARAGVAAHHLLGLHVVCDGGTVVTVYWRHEKPRTRVRTPHPRRAAARRARGRHVC